MITRGIEWGKGRKQTTERNGNFEGDRLFYNLIMVRVKQLRQFLKPWNYTLKKVNLTVCM